MANKIMGITVEIGGDTTKLQTALKEVISFQSLQKISAVFYLHDEYEKCFYMTKSN